LYIFGNGFVDQTEMLRPYGSHRFDIEYISAIELSELVASIPMTRDERGDSV
jgi:hypothetical protein